MSRPPSSQTAHSGLADADADADAGSVFTPGAPFSKGGSVAVPALVLPEPAHQALVQRVSALNRFVHDVYHAQEIIKAGVVPREQIENNASAVAEAISYWWVRTLGNTEGTDVMIGGAPWLSEPLERALKREGFRPVYAFSKRISVEETLPDGTVKKTQVFRHEGFVPAA